MSPKQHNRPTVPVFVSPSQSRQISIKFTPVSITSFLLTDFGFHLIFFLVQLSSWKQKASYRLLI